ncbi:MAG: zinc finger MYND domain-containing protein, partial [Sphingobacteriaceae bacterium]
AQCHDQLKKTQRCARCQTVAYCSKECQKTHWDTHRSFCKKHNENRHRVETVSGRDEKERFVGEIQPFLHKLLSVWYLPSNHWNRRKDPLHITFSASCNEITDIRFVLDTSVKMI